MKYDYSIFIFRRDLRLIDNIALNYALKLSNIVIPIFIFTPEQLDSNIYKSNNCVQFMIESLLVLNDDLNKYGSRLFFWYGSPHIIIKKIIKSTKSNAIFVNKDYTEYSQKRDYNIKIICKQYNVDFISCEDILLNNIGSIRTNNGSIYTKFTPYYNKAKKTIVCPAIKKAQHNFIDSKISFKGEYKKNINNLYIHNKYLAVNGGRHGALEILQNLEQFNKYNKDRNIISKNTTKLSAYIKFGCVSIREVYGTIKEKLGLNNDLIKQLYWREFYYNVAYYNSFVLNKNLNQNFKQNYINIPWNTVKSASSSDLILWYKWCDGLTGYPIIDAAMRELNITGYMHNRGRLIVSNFLIKLMLWHWLDGELYFAQKLVDYDPILNNGNYQWSAGSGVDAQPYFRIFNPWTQSIKFDHSCLYIKKWIPELANVEPLHIHKWYIYCKNDEKIKYPCPMIDYEKSRTNSLAIFKQYL